MWRASRRIGRLEIAGALLGARMIARGGFAGSACTTRYPVRMCLALLVDASVTAARSSLAPRESSGVGSVELSLI